MQSMLMLSDSYKHIKALNAYKDKLLSLIAHDLKNPIYTIKLLLEMSMQKEISESQRDEIIRSVNSSAGSAFGLLENLLSWANSQRNKILLKPEIFDLYDLINENVKLLALQADNKSVEMISNVQPKTNLFADKNMVSTILRNLLSNAVKFSETGGMVNVFTEQKGNTYIIGIKDKGCGIDDVKINKILKGMLQYTSLGTQKESGSGIGLQLSADFVKKNGGEIWAETNPEGGSTFYFSLPKRPDD
jgi:signal transduction histidine kinase